MNEVRSEVGLLVELVVVEPDERAAEQDGQSGAACCVQDGDREQRAADRPQHARKRHHRHRGVAHHEHEGEGGRGERPDVFGDALVGVRQHARGAQVVVGSSVEVRVEELPSEPFPPEQPQPLLAEGVEGTHGCRGCEHPEVCDGLPGEPRRVAVRDGRHEVPAHVAVHHVQGVERQEQGDEQGEERSSAPTDLAGGEVSDRLAEPRPRESRDGDPVVGHHRGVSPRINRTFAGSSSMVACAPVKRVVALPFTTTARRGPSPGG